MEQRFFADIEEGVLPFSAEAEQSVLGAIIIDPQSFILVEGLLKPEYFYLNEHKRIYETLHLMFEQSNTIDLVTLLEKLKDNGIYDDAGGKEYITRLVQTVPSAANIVTYANIIKDRYYKRTLIKVAQGIIKDANENVVDTNGLLSAAEQRIYEIRQGKEIAGLEHIRNVITYETCDRLAKITDPETRDDYIGIPTGIGDLDKTITGLNKSDLIILGARPGMGKTAFALNIARNVAMKKKTVCFFSLEMSRDQLAQRLLSSEAGIASTKMRTGELSPDEWTRLGTAGSELSKLEMYLDETSTLTVPEMKAKLLRMKKVDLVVVDYLGLMKSPKHIDSRVLEVQEITRGLKVLAKELKVPIIVCAQLSRGTETRGKSHKPGLSDLRESGSIEQDADIVLFLYREKYYDNEKDENAEPSDETKAECIVAKNRHGELRTIDLHWDAQFTRFSSRDNFRDE